MNCPEFALGWKYSILTFQRSPTCILCVVRIKLTVITAGYTVPNSAKMSGKNKISFVLFEA